MDTEPAPRANPDLEGHEAAERTLRQLYEAGRLPHAILLCGPRGIGKATLAFRLARFVLANPPAGHGGDGAAPEGLAIDPDSGVFRRVAAGGHADLLTVERAYDPRRRRLRSEIVVDDTREITGFLRLTAAEGGWRVVIIDGADAMNRNAANALLKILEEPPRQALLLLVAHSPGRLLPTIRSRCRRLALAPLPLPLVARLLQRYRPGLAEAEALAALSGGSIGRALELADAGGLELHRALLDMLARAPDFELPRLHEFADRLAAGDAEEGQRAFEELLAQVLAHAATGSATAVAGEGRALARLAALAPPPRWAERREAIIENFDRTRDLNLDRKQAVLDAFFAIAGAAR
jgi:DNA polymerase III subunit delta'